MTTIGESYGKRRNVYFNTLEEMRDVLMIARLDQIVTNSVEFGNKNASIQTNNGRNNLFIKQALFQVKSGQAKLSQTKPSLMIVTRYCIKNIYIKYHNSQPTTIIFLPA